MMMMNVVLWDAMCSPAGIYQRSAEMLVTTYKTTQHHNPEDHNSHLHHHEKLKSQIIIIIIIIHNVTNYKFILHNNE
jgi:hypothetical protein